MGMIITPLEESYARGYKQGKFDAELDALNETEEKPRLSFSIIIAIFAGLMILASFIAQALPVCKMPI